MASKPGNTRKTGRLVEEVCATASQKQCFRREAALLLRSSGTRNGQKLFIFPATTLVFFHLFDGHPGLQRVAALLIAGAW